MKLIPIIDGDRSQFERLSVDRAADRIAQAHKDGLPWDCRVATSGQGYRLLTETEQQTLIIAVTNRVANNESHN